MASEAGINQDEQFVGKLRDLISGNLDKEDFGVKELAHKAGYSRSQLHRKVKQITGRSASVFIRQVRLEHALEMLRHNEATTSEIAYRVGFHSPSYFHRCFHKRFGITPGEFKERSENNPDYLSYNKDEPSHRPTPPINPKSKRELHLSFLIPRISIAILLALVVLSYFMYGTEAAEDPEKTSIAVLPFTYLSDRDDTAFLADGMMEDLLHRLSRIRNLKVISRTSSEVYRDRGSRSIRDIADQLDVQYIVEGSVQCLQDKARIHIKLIDAASDQPVWSRNYDRRILDIFALQSEIALNIATEVQQVLSEDMATQLEKPQTENIHAFELYSLGNFELMKRTGSGYVRAINYFREALEADPGYGQAYTGLAETYFLMAMNGEIGKDQARNLSYSLAQKALEADPNLAEANALLGAIKGFMDYDWVEAEITLRESIRLNPNFSHAYLYLSLLLYTTGDPEEARQIMEQAKELDPFSYIIRFQSAEMYFHQKDYINALSETERCKEILPEHGWSDWLKFKIFLMEKKEVPALNAFKDLGSLSLEYYPKHADSAFVAEGMTGLLKLRLERTDNHLHRAESFAIMNQADSAVNILRNAFERDRLNPKIAGNSHFRSLHDLPEFNALLKQMNLSQQSAVN